MNNPNEALPILQDRYALIQELSSKPGRKTWLAQDLNYHALVVVKLLLFNRKSKWEEWRLFEREAGTLKSLSHAAIPQYLDFFEVDLATLKGFALVQSYIAGKSLQAALEQGRKFREAEVNAIAISLLDVLIYLQSRQPAVIHRDIKPSNIILHPDFSLENPETQQVYLVDFGSVRTVTPPPDRTFTVVGTYGYMPPEQFGGKAFPASDLYSLGIMLIALNSGQQPADLPQKELKLQFESFVDFSPKFTQWLQKLIEPSLEKRFASALAAKTNLLASETRIAKPSETKISLTKDAYFIQILIPHGKWSFESILGLGFSCLFNIGTIAALILIQPILVNPAVYKITLLFILCCGILGIIGSLYNIWGIIRLRIDHQQILRMNLLYGWGYEQPESSPSRHIESLERTDRKIIIRAGKKRYELGNNLQLTDEELDWLATELSDWLRLPIIRNSA